MRCYNVRFLAGNPALIAQGQPPRRVGTDGPYLISAAIEIARDRIPADWRAWVEHSLTGERAFENSTERQWRKPGEVVEAPAVAPEVAEGWRPTKYEEGVTVFGHREFGEIRVRWSNRTYCIGPPAGHWRQVLVGSHGRGWQAALARHACEVCARSFVDQDDGVGETESGETFRP